MTINTVHTRYLFLCTMAVVAISTLPVESVLAQAEDNLLQDSLDEYESQMMRITGEVRGLLINTFYYLALIELTWTMIKTYLDNGGLQNFVSALVERIMYIGFFTYLFRAGTDIPLAIVDSFRSLGSRATGRPAELTPDNILDIGQNFMTQSISVITGGSIILGIVLLVPSVGVFIAMVILAAHLAVAILEFYVVGYGGFVLLAFGASRWTDGYAKSYLKYAMSVGMKLFVLYIIVGVIEVEMAAYLANVQEHSATNVWAVAAFAIFSVILAIIASQSVMGMMSGVSVGSGGAAVQAGAALGGAAIGVGKAAKQTGSAALSGAAGAMGAGSAASSAAKLGSAAAGASGKSGMSAAASGAGAVGKELGGGAVSAGKSALAKAFPVEKSMGGKLAARMNAARKKIEDSK